MIKLLLLISKELHRKLKQFAKEEETTVNGAIRQILIKYFKEGK